MDAQVSITDGTSQKRQSGAIVDVIIMRLLGEKLRLLSDFGVMGSGLVVNRPREAESLGVGPDRAVDPLVALGAEESESHGEPDQVDEPARRSEVL